MHMGLHACRHVSACVRMGPGTLDIGHWTWAEEYVEVGQRRAEEGHGCAAERVPLRIRVN